jgi:hypothetical protein
MSATRSAEFDVDALYEALDERRRALGLTWAGTARAISEQFRDAPSRAISASTLTRTRGANVLEGDGVLQMLRWLGRVPESFVPGHAGGAPLPDIPHDEILRFDTKLIHAALDERRTQRGMSWSDVATEIRGVTAASLTRMSQGGRTMFPLVVRIAAWLERPVASLTRASRS